MARTISLAALQTSDGRALSANIRNTGELIRQAAGSGALRVLPA